MLKYRQMIWRYVFLMQDIFYNIGYYAIYAIPVTIALVCINRIIRNRTEIKNLEKDKEEKQDKK